jgi:hypothetical protein
MDEDFVYIEGDLGEDERNRLLRLIRRVEKAVDFQFEADGLAPTWIVVVGWGSGDTGPIRISRFRSGLIFSAPDVDGAARKMEQWLDKHE